MPRTACCYLINCKYYFLFYVIFWLTTSKCYSATKVEKKKIHVGALVPWLDHHDDFCFYSAMSVAVRDINNDSRLLKDYELVIHYRDSYGSSGMVILSYFNLTNQNVTLQAMIGPAYGNAIEPIAILTSNLMLPQISYASTGITNRFDVYPYFISIIPSIVSYAQALAGLFQYFEWKRVAIIYQYMQPSSFLAVNELTILLKESGVEIIALIALYHNVKTDEIFDRIEAADARIIIGAFFEVETGQQLLCEAYKRGMYGPAYQYILFNKVPLKDVKLPNCTNKEVFTAATGALVLGQAPLRGDNHHSHTGKSAHATWDEIKEFYIKEVWEKYLNTTREEDNVLKLYKNATFAYDAVYMVAIALQNVINKQGPEGLMTHYHDKEKAKAFTDEMFHSDFEGITGKISYDKHYTKERLGEVLFLQFQGVQYLKGFRNLSEGHEEVAIFITEKDQLKFFKKPKDLFEDKKAPSDRSPLPTRIARNYSKTLVGTIWCGAFLGIIFSSILLTINVHYRKIRLIKMSSPNINNGIVAGCLLCYLSVIVYGVQPRAFLNLGGNFTCFIVKVSLSFGFTLSFSCLFAKTWRVYRVFTAAKTMGRVVIKDSHLYVMIGSLLLLDAVIFIIWGFVSPFTMTERELKRTTVDNVVNVYYLLECGCTYKLHFSFIMFGYKAVLLLLGLFLAWETRKVQIPVLNDSKYIGMSVYKICVVSTIGVICASGLDSHGAYDEEYIVIALCVFICTTGTLLLIFVPKIIMLFHKPNDDHRKSYFYERSSSRKDSKKWQVETPSRSLNSQVTDLHEDVELPSKHLLNGSNNNTNGSVRKLRFQNGNSNGHIARPLLGNGSHSL